MNEPNLTPPVVPSPPITAPNPNDPGSAAERAPIRGPLDAVTAILRQPRRVMTQLHQAPAGRLALVLLLIAAVCSLLYGVVIGTFSGGGQVWAAAVKAMLVLLASALICLPSLYVFACLSGAEVRPGELAGLVAAQLALMAVLLVGFAPVAWVFGQSTESVAAMGVLHLAFGLIATGFSLRFLANAFGHLNARSKGGLRIWMLIWVTVMLQMTTALRPLIGSADSFLPATKQFFLQHWLECLK
ncbi:MAG: hypothetical protein ABSC03_10150 [Verrucomicrobiota bacterium]